MIEIKSLKLKIGDKEIELSAEEAKALRDELDKILGPQNPLAAQVPFIPTPIYIQPYIPPPVWTPAPTYPQWPDEMIIACGTNAIGN
jgi:hypothetical protein